LGSRLIKGIGPITAKQIVKEFGEESLNIIEHKIDKLKEIDGIDNERILMIQKSLREIEEIQRLMVFLQFHGASWTYATKIYAKLGNDSIAKIKKNPYILVTKLHDISFSTVDKIAEKLSFSKDRINRVRAGIIYVLNQISYQGNVCFPFISFIKRCQELLNVDQTALIDALNILIGENKLLCEGFKVTDCWQYWDNWYVWDDRDEWDEWYHRHDCNDHHALFVLIGPSEFIIADKLKTLIRTPKSFNFIDSDKALNTLTPKLHFSLTLKQIEAIRIAITNKVLVITGGVGTGKTGIVNAILNIFANREVKLLLIAPSGMAAQKIREVTGHEAHDINALLKSRMAEKFEQPFLMVDLVILMEAAMIDTILMGHLLQALHPKATLILVGDVNQLPSEGAGNVLNDIIASGSVPVVALNDSKTTGNPLIA
jgi:exodeoxyribonuclease V alpha subunit